MFLCGCNSNTHANIGIMNSSDDDNDSNTYPCLSTMSSNDDSKQEHSLLFLYSRQSPRENRTYMSTGDGREPYTNSSAPVV